MIKSLMFLFSFLLTVPLVACSDNTMYDRPPQTGEESEGGSEEDTNENDINMKLVVVIDSSRFYATLENNETVNAFKEMLPMTISMSEFNSNEKFYGLPLSLPTNASNPGTIRNGDLMLFGNTTLVLFYKTFTTSYGYTKIGCVDDPSGLESALGSGDVTVTFELEQID